MDPSAKPSYFVKADWDFVKLEGLGLADRSFGCFGRVHNLNYFDREGLSRSRC